GELRLDAVEDGVHGGAGLLLVEARGAGYVVDQIRLVHMALRQEHMRKRAVLHGIARDGAASSPSGGATPLKNALQDGNLGLRAAAPCRRRRGVERLSRGLPRPLPGPAPPPGGPSPRRSGAPRGRGSRTAPPRCAGAPPRSCSG